MFQSSTFFLITASSGRVALIRNPSSSLFLALSCNHTSMWRWGAPLACISILSNFARGFPNILSFPKHFLIALLSLVLKYTTASKGSYWLILGACCPLSRIFCFTSSFNSLKRGSLSLRVNVMKRSGWFRPWTSSMCLVIAFRQWYLLWMYFGESMCL